VLVTSINWIATQRAIRSLNGLSAGSYKSSADSAVGQYPSVILTTARPKQAVPCSSQRAHLLMDWQHDQMRRICRLASGLSLARLPPAKRQATGHRHPASGTGKARTDRLSWTDMSVHFITTAYSILGTVFVLSYLPQLKTAVRTPGRGEGISLLAWAFWTLYSVISLLYAGLVMKDPTLTMVSVGSLVGCGSVTAVVAIKRFRPVPQS